MCHLSSCLCTGRTGATGPMVSGKQHVTNKHMHIRLPSFTKYLMEHYKYKDNMKLIREQHYVPCLQRKRFVVILSNPEMDILF